MARRIGLLASLVVLASCGAIGERHAASLTGELAYVERITLPPGAQARVVLRAAPTVAGPPVDPAHKSAGSGEIVAQDVIEIADGAPIPFQLDYRRDAMHPPHALVIDAWISAAGQVLFAVSDAAVGGTSGAPARLILRRPHHIAYLCDDGSRPAVAFLAMSEIAFLEAEDDAPVALRAQPVGSGFYYTGEGYGLRGKGREAILQRPSGSGTPCIVPPADNPRRYRPGSFHHPDRA